MSFTPGNSNIAAFNTYPTNYRIKQRNQGQTNWQVISDTTYQTSGRNTFVATNLVYGQTYEYQVEAYNDAGTAQNCEIYTLVFRPRICPNPPQGLTQTGNTGGCGTTQFTLSW